METKSRYEVISDLENKKRELIRERDSFNEQIGAKEKQIKFGKRQIEDMEEDLKTFKGTVEEKKSTIKALIESIDDSLKRLGDSQSQKK